MNTTVRVVGGSALVVLSILGVFVAGVLVAFAFGVRGLCWLAGIVALVLFCRWGWKKAQIAEDVAADYASRQADTALRKKINRRLLEEKR